MSFASLMLICALSAMLGSLLTLAVRRSFVSWQQRRAAAKVQRARRTLYGDTGTN